MGRSCLHKWWTGTIDQRLLEKAHGGTQVVRTLQWTLLLPAIATIHTPSERGNSYTWQLDFCYLIWQLDFVTLYGNHPDSGGMADIVSVTMPLLSIKYLAAAIFHQSGTC